VSVPLRVTFRNQLRGTVPLTKRRRQGRPVFDEVPVCTSRKEKNP